MAVKYYAGSPVSGKKMDGFTFVFEAIEAVSGTWQGVFKSEDIAEIAALSKLKSEGAVKEISEETYNDLLKKKSGEASYISKLERRVGTTGCGSCGPSSSQGVSR